MYVKDFLVLPTTLFCDFTIVLCTPHSGVATSDIYFGEDHSLACSSVTFVV